MKRYLPTAVLVLTACVVAGVASAYAGGIAGERPLFIVALPLLLAMGFAFVLSPKSLAVAIIVLRAGADPVFQGTQLAGLGGLGGMVNLAVIALACVLVLREPKRVPAAAWLTWAPFLTMQLIGCAYSPDAYTSLRLAFGQVSTAMMFIIAFYLVDDLASFDRVLKLIVLSSVPVAALALMAIAQGNSTSSMAGMEATYGRYGAPFPHPNILAFYAVLVIGMLLVLWKQQRSTAGPLLKAGYVLHIVLMLGLLFATKTRSAWICAALLFFLYGLFVQRRYLVYLIALGALAMLAPQFRDRVMELGQGNEVVQYARLNSFAWRELIWTSGLQWMDSSRYLLGYGAGSFLHHSVTFFPLAGGNHFGAHSVFVQLFFEGGVVGLVSFLWLFWATLKLMQASLRVDRTIAIVFLALLATYLVISSSDNMLAYLVFNWYFWLAMGAACAVGRCVSAAGDVRSGGRDMPVPGRRWKPDANAS